MTPGKPTPLIWGTHKERLLFLIHRCKGRKKLWSCSYVHCYELFERPAVCVKLQEKRKTTDSVKLTILLWFQFHCCKSTDIKQIVVNLSLGWYHLLMFLLFSRGRTPTLDQKWRQIRQLKQQYKKYQHPTFISLSPSSHADAHTPAVPWWYVWVFSALCLERGPVSWEITGW